MAVIKIRQTLAMCLPQRRRKMLGMAMLCVSLTQARIGGKLDDVENQVKEHKKNADH
jgi:hypothetical protein